MFPSAVEPFFRYGAFIPAQLLVLPTLVAFVLGFRVRAWWAWTVTAIGLLTFAVGLLIRYPPLGTDIHFFWLAGRDICTGIDPYRNTFCLNPPTALPLFALFGLFPYPEILATWTVLNGLGLVFLVVLADRALAVCPETKEWRLPATMLGVASAALVLSGAAQSQLVAGQLCVVVVLGLLAALYGRLSGRSTWTGIGLAVASVKPATMVPFLVLFLRKRDRAVWGWMLAVALALTLTVTSLVDLPGRASECLADISIQAQPGGMNYPFIRTAANLIGMDRALHYLGAGEPATIRIMHGLIVAALLGWVAWRARTLSDSAAWSLASFASMLFLYHRVYDLVLLVVPLLYAVGRARTESGACRWWYAGTVGAILGLLYFRAETVQMFCREPLIPGIAGHVANAIVVPHAVWLLLAGMVLLNRAERLRASRASSVAAKAAETNAVIDLTETIVLSGRTAVQTTTASEPAESLS